MALKDKAGKIVSDPTAVKGVVRDFYEDRGKPINGKKTGIYDLKGAPRDYPWSQDKNDFMLKSRVGKSHTKRISLLDLIQDKA